MPKQIQVNCQCKQDKLFDTLNRYGVLSKGPNRKIEKMSLLLVIPKFNLQFEGIC